MTTTELTISTKTAETLAPHTEVLIISGQYAGIVLAVEILHGRKVIVHTTMGIARFAANETVEYRVRAPRR